MNSLEVRRLSLTAQVDPKTVYRYLRGDRVRPSSEERIRAAAKKLKLALGGGPK